MYQRWVCCVRFFVFCVPAVCPVCLPCMRCVLCASCAPYALGIGCVLWVFAVRCVLCLAASLHHSVTLSSPCSAFTSHRNSVPVHAYAIQFRLHFVPFLVPRGRLYGAPRIPVLTRLWKPPSTSTRYNFVSFSSLFSCLGADNTCTSFIHLITF